MEANGVVNCGKWIKRPENQHLVVIGKSFPRESSLKSTLEIFSFDKESFSLSSSPVTTHVMEEGNPINIAVHPSGDHFVCLTTAGDCKLYELTGKETDVKVLEKEMSPLQGIGLQKCVAFSFDGSRLATGGENGHLRIFQWPSLQIVLDEPRAHKSFRDMDFSLDSEFLASTSTDGAARIWNANEGSAITNLMRNPDEKIELCRFSMDGTKPFLFCTVQKGDKSLTSVWDISTWKKIGNKRLLRKPAAVMSVSMDGKYLAFSASTEHCRTSITTNFFFVKSKGRVSAMEMIRSNDKYNLSIHQETQSSSKVSISNLIKQLKPSSPLPPPRTRSHSKMIQSTETWPIERKKQVRRRVHTTKPYQERLLNMAEARKEIVSALKLHRASMKKQQQSDIIPELMHQIQSDQRQQQPQPIFVAEAVQDCYTNLDAAGNLKLSPDPPATRVDPCVLHVDQETVSGLSEGGAVEPRALDEEEMAEMRSVGKMHQMEWDDTLNLATYALWFKILHQMDHSEQDDHSASVAINLDKLFM